MSKPRIFYVEDESFLAKIVKETLESKGYEVILEDSGENAVARFAATRPDVCLLDVMLPHKDGFAIADEIRETDTKVPIIFLTARSAVAEFGDWAMTYAVDGDVVTWSDVEALPPHDGDEEQKVAEVFNTRGPGRSPSQAHDPAGRVPGLPR